MSMSRIATALVGACFLAHAPGLAAAEGSADAASVARLRIEVINLHSNRGSVYCSVYAEPGAGFPTDQSKAKVSVKAAIKDQQALCEFADLTPGVYAVTMLHDENDNGKIDTDWMGIPKEGYGATRDAKGIMGPPKFKDAAFTYKGGGLTMQVRARYGG
jgi:uncharacterized protein (DUF2141 family)